MSVYTTVSDTEFSELLNNYALGDFVSAQGIQAGVENTYYFLTTSKGEYVFTVFEKISRDEVSFYILLLQQLHIAGITCPQPQADRHLQIINELKDKPYTIVSRLKGKNLTSVNRKQCKAIATELAKLHITSLPGIKLTNPLLQNRRGKDWRYTTALQLQSKLSPDEAGLISAELESYLPFDDSDLPKGIIHADLFPDNALFDGDQLSGIIDFYDACYDNYLYDVAITVNAWCCNQDGEIIEALVDEFLHSYQQVRPFTIEEKNAWPMMLRMAAMRFWLSRLDDSLSADHLHSRKGVLTLSKNPVEYRQILENHLKSAVY